MLELCSKTQENVRLSLNVRLERGMPGLSYANTGYEETQAYLKSAFQQLSITSAVVAAQCRYGSEVYRSEVLYTAERFDAPNDFMRVEFGKASCAAASGKRRYGEADDALSFSYLA